jgi:hypothetical protein
MGASAELWCGLYFALGLAAWIAYFVWQFCHLQPGWSLLPYLSRLPLLVTLWPLGLMVLAMVGWEKRRLRQREGYSETKPS